MTTYKSIFVLFTAIILAGCSAAYKDGVYTGRSGADDKGAWGEVTLTIKDGKPAECSFVTYQRDGKIKGEDYGKVNGAISNQDYYAKAQLALRAMKQYEQQYNRSRNLNDVQAVSGATNSYDQFLEAVENALDSAR
jgi:major membrane immunogen (membrane-anchored lipoprotein)